MSAVITPFEGTELFNTASFNNRIEQINTGFSYVSNPNLLDNAYFLNPVDQRGGYIVPKGVNYYKVVGGMLQGPIPETVRVDYIDEFGSARFDYGGGPCFVPKAAGYVRGYTGNGYTVDRWMIGAGSNGTLSLADGGLKLARTDGIMYLTQRILKTQIPEGNVLTYSVLTTSGLFSTSFVVKNDTYHEQVVGGGISLGWNYTPAEMVEFTLVNNTVNSDVTVLAVKLELGPAQTLAHREGDKWVLSEVPEYGEQLRRCQRYCRVIGGTLNEPICIAIRRESTMLEGCILFDFPMRTAPSVLITGTFSTIPEFLGIEFTSQDSISPEGVSLFFKQQNGAPFAGTAYLIYAPSDTRITFSADL
uniref:Uncharacterized protein n=1 Tax=Siphoviridae sp. ctKy93 TaxID=2827569 RepID=A0A8S5RRC9_9CAUD|nr:MAG TPA: hypothetical protein [Siphoviridae sp. ctKy93]